MRFGIDKSMKSARFYLLLILVMAFGGIFTACQPKMKPESDCNFVMSGQVQRVSWKAKLPVTLYISSSVPMEYRETIRIAAAQWNYKMNKVAFIIQDSDLVADNPAKDNTSVIYWRTSWDDEHRNEQARTTIHWRGDQITEADMSINAEDNQFTAFGELAPGKVDFTSLIVHELGHVMGLQHIQGQESVMAPTLAQNIERSNPYEVDLNSLKCEYNM